MLGVLIATVLGFAALAGIVLYVIRQQIVERERVDRELHDDRTPTLEYLVPTGQDPVVIVTALERAGYTATVDPNHTRQLVLVACPEGVDRHRSAVRSVIEAASVTTPQDGIPLEPEVRFRDEQ